jgi:hypothetical protein
MSSIFNYMTGAAPAVEAVADEVAKMTLAEMACPSDDDEAGASVATKAHDHVVLATKAVLVEREVADMMLATMIDEGAVPPAAQDLARAVDEWSAAGGYDAAMPALRELGEVMAVYTRLVTAARALPQWSGARVRACEAARCAQNDVKAQVEELNRVLPPLPAEPAPSKEEQAAPPHTRRLNDAFCEYEAARKQQGDRLNALDKAAQDVDAAIDDADGLHGALKLLACAQDAYAAGMEATHAVRVAYCEAVTDKMASGRIEWLGEVEKSCLYKVYMSAYKRQRKLAQVAGKAEGALHAAALANYIASCATTRKAEAAFNAVNNAVMSTPPIAKPGDWSEASKAAPDRAAYTVSSWAEPAPTAPSKEAPVDRITELFEYEAAVNRQRGLLKALGEASRKTDVGRAAGLLDDALDAYDAGEKVVYAAGIAATAALFTPYSARWGVPTKRVRWMNMDEVEVLRIVYTSAYKRQHLLSLVSDKASREAEAAMANGPASEEAKMRKKVAIVALAAYEASMQTARRAEAAFNLCMSTPPLAAQGEKRAAVDAKGPHIPTAAEYREGLVARKRAREADPRWLGRQQRVLHSLITDRLNAAMGDGMSGLRFGSDTPGFRPGDVVHMEYMHSLLEAYTVVTTYDDISWSLEVRVEED